MNWLYSASCAVLLYTSVCRMVHTSRDTTRLDVRMAVVLLGAGAAAALFSVWGWGYSPQWPDFVLATGAAAMNVVGSRVWRDGVPVRYIRNR